MSGTASDRWFYADWLSDPAVRSCSIGARGLWMDMLCIMGEADPKGYLLIDGKPVTMERLARIAGIAADEAEKLCAELVDNSAASRDRSGRIYCRRMVRDEKKRKASQKGGKIGGRVTHEKQTGIFTTQDTTQGATKEPTQHPRRARAVPSRNPVTLEEETLVSASSLTQPPQENFVVGKSAGGNGTGRKTGKQYAPGTTTIADPTERMARFQKSIADRVKDGWVTIKAAMDRRDHNHRHALEACKAEAAKQGKGWPHDWPYLEPPPLTFDERLAQNIPGGMNTVLLAKDRTAELHEWAMTCARKALDRMHEQFPADWSP